MPKVKKQPIYHHPKQQKFRDSDAWCRGFVAGRNCGKSTIGARDILLRARNHEPWCCVSRSFPDIMKVTWPVFEREARLMNVYIRGVKTPIPKIYFRTQDNGTASLTFNTATNADDLRGPSWAGMWIDEASQMHEDVKLFGIPSLRHEMKMGKLLMTFTPRGRKHWTFEMFYEELSDDDKERVFESENGPTLDGQPLYEFGGKYHRSKDNTFLVHATTLENPFSPEEFYGLVRANYTTALASQELGGNFIDIEGLIFERHWFEQVDSDMVPRDAARVRYWDKAATHGDGCYTAGVLMARDSREVFYVEDVVRGQWSYDEREKVIAQTTERDARRYTNEVQVHIEQEPGSGGKESAQQTIKRLMGYPVFLDVVSQGHQHKTVDNLKVPGQAKITRAMPLAAQAEAGNVRVVIAKWTDDWLDELCAFPESKFSDQVDASSGAFNKVCKVAVSWQAPSYTARDNPPDRFGVQRQQSIIPSHRGTGSRSDYGVQSLGDDIGTHLLTPPGE